jgi:DNA-binding CsgD family transcriptional regulator
MAHSTITVEEVDRPDQLAVLFATAARLGVRVQSGRISARRIQLELEEQAPASELRCALESLGMRAFVAPGTHLADGLSPRERELVIHLAAGLQLKEVATQMGVQVHTVREYWLRVKRKWNVKTVGQAVSLWTEHGHEHLE